MDIKSKNNKKITLVLSIGFLFIVAVGFYLFYPTFKERAEIFMPLDQNTETFTEEDLLERLYQQNYVFYKDYQEFKEKKEISFGDLYLKIQKQSLRSESEKEQTAQAGDQANDYLEIEEFQDVYEEDILNMITQQWVSINAKMEEWSKRNSDLIGKGLDYCVIEATNEYLNKNTNIALEAAITGTEEQKRQLLEHYLFLIRFSYDTSGRLDTIQTQGENEDELLKICKTKEKQKFFSDLIYCVIDDLEQQIEKVTLSFASPKEITIIYGMTRQQWETLLELTENANYQLSERRLAYKNAGVSGILYLVFFGILVATYFLPKLSEYQLYKYQIFQRIPLEVILLTGFLCLSLGTDKILTMMIQTNDGYYLKQLDTIELGTIEVSKGLVGAYNIFILFLIFSLWFIAATALYPIQKQGVRVYLSQRCFSYSMLVGIKDWIKGFWKELTGYDLSKRTEWLLLRLVLVNFIVLIFAVGMFDMIGLVLYSIALLFLLRRWVYSVKKQYETMLNSAQQLADGDLTTQIMIDTGIFQRVSEELTQIQAGLKNAVEEELKSQRMKTELITNVSHDLKTPLTAIITYIDLLKQDNLTPEKRKEYLTTLENKSHRLKDLIEDLFEISKATSNNVTLNIIDIDIVSLMKQIWLELSDRVEESKLEFRFDFPEKKVILPLDSQKTYRIFENLYVNILKYAMQGTRVYISVKWIDDSVKIELKNISAAELTINPSELAERFVRGDTSRNTEGSGLGLAIAKSFTELQKGRMEIETDGDLFKVTLWWQSNLSENIGIQNIGIEDFEIQDQEKGEWY